MPRPRQAWLACATLFAALATLPITAQLDSSGQRTNTAYLDISIEAATHLRTAASYAADRNWPEAIDLLQKLIERFGDKVIQVGSSPVYVSVRDYCHIQLCGMPPEARLLYRKLADGQAEIWYRTGVAERDRELLGQVVDRAFASSWGDNALDALAELAFEAGRFEEAYLLWTRVMPELDARPPAAPPPADSAPYAGLVYPDSDLDPALIEAKRILSRWFLGEREQAMLDVERFRQRYPNARGTLGAVAGVLAERLTAIIRGSAAAPAPQEAVWTTFAGNAQRSKVQPQAVDIGSVQWTAKLPQAFHPRTVLGSRPMSVNSPEDYLSFHPLVLGDQVVVCGREEVLAYDLHDAPKEPDKPLWSFRLRDGLGATGPVAVRQPLGAPHYTMTADRGRLYVRLGAPETTVPLRRGGQPDSYLVCLDLAADAKELWRTAPDEPELAFEGSPVVADGEVFVGVTRGGAMTHSYVACYDADTGAKKWRQLICEASSAITYNSGTISHNLPTLGAGMLFYNTNLGTVAAIDQQSGRVRWIATYPRDARDEFFTTRTPGRELSPCLYYNGLVIAMPSDTNGVYAFDALSGALRWKTPEQPRLSHMLGVARGNVICTGKQVVAIDATNGAHRWTWSEGPNTAPYGRGALAGDYVYFPTKTHIYVLDQRTGLSAKETIALQEKHHQSPGNLVIGEGYMVVAQAKGLLVMCQYDVLINRYRDLIAQNPNSAEPHYSLAQAAENTDRALAVEHYRKALELPSQSGFEEDRRMKQSARTKLYSLLLQLGEQAAADRQWEATAAHLREAVAIAPTTQGKLDALLRLAETWAAAGEATKTLVAYQEVLDDDSLRALAIQVEPNRSVRADVEVTRRVQVLVDKWGREVYSAVDARAAELLAEARESNSLAAVARLVRTYPNAQVVPQALQYLGTQLAAQNQFAESIAAFKQLLAQPNAPVAVQVAAHHGVAVGYESLGSWAAAREWWERLAAEFPGEPAPGRGDQSVSAFVADRLEQSPLKLAAVRERGGLRLPLARRWNRVWSDRARVFIPHGAPPQEPGFAVLVTTPDTLDCLAASSGELLWSAKLTDSMRWAAFHGDLMLIGTDVRIIAADAATGAVRWQQRTATGLPGFKEFRLVDDRVFVNEDDRRLVCLSAAKGEMQWAFSPTEGVIAPNTFFSSHHVALRTSKPDKLIVLDGDGRRRFELTQASELWKQAPVAVDAHHLCIATDARTIQLIDLNDGKPVWSFGTLNSDQRAVPMVGGGCLLVLVGGNQLVRVKPQTGEPLWSTRVSEDVLPAHAGSWMVDGRTFYCVTRQSNLRAFRLDDGRIQWQQFLVPSGDWQLAAQGTHMLALPRRPDATEGLPLVICRQSDGSPVQRLVFRPRGNSALVHVAADHAVIGSEHELWALAKED